MTSLLNLYGLLFFILICVACLLSFRLTLNNEFSFCLKEISHLQRQHRDITKKLLNLNSKAKSLRLKRHSAQIAYTAAPPPLKPAALAKLKAVKAKQLVFRMVQKSLFTKAKAVFYTSKLRFYNHSYRLNRGSSSLKVKPYPIGSDSPSYKLERGYTRKKKIVFKKSTDLNKHSSFLVKKIITKTKKINTLKHLTCGASLDLKGGKPSKVKLILDKF